MKGKRGLHAGEFLDVLATGGRDSVVNIYDRRYSKKRRWWSFFHLDRTSVVLRFVAEGALHPINSITCAHSSSTALQKTARVRNERGRRSALMTFARLLI